MLLNEISQHVLYHASFDPINKFWPLSHFGTYKAALHRIRSVLEDTFDDATPFEDWPVFLYPVRLNIYNPLRTTDIYNERPYVVGETATWILNHKLKMLDDEAKGLAHKLKNATTTPATTRRLAQLLKLIGHDGLVYRNRVEDPGHLSWINLSSDQVTMTGKPIQLSSSEILYGRKRDLVEAADRPAELGEGYFWIDGHLVDIRPERNHRDWLVNNAERLGLPSWVSSKPSKALWEGYKRGILRVVWDPKGAWRTGAAHGQGRVLYINGTERDVWRNMRAVLNHPHWQGMIDSVVLEYVRDLSGKPNWYHTDIFRGGALESLYRGKRPRRELAPSNAAYGGEPSVDQLREVNHLMNNLNDTPGPILEMFNQHFLSSEFFDFLKHVPQNKYVLQDINYNVYT